MFIVPVSQQSLSKVLRREELRIQVIGEPIRKSFVLRFGFVRKNRIQPALKDFFQHLFIL